MYQPVSTMQFYRVFWIFLQIASLLKASTAQNDFFRSGDLILNYTLIRRDKCFTDAHIYNSTELEIAKNGTHEIILNWPAHVRCDLGFAEAKIYLNDNAKTPSECNSSGESQFKIYRSRTYKIQEKFDKTDDSNEITFDLATQGCFFAQINYTKYPSNKSLLFKSRPTFVQSRVSKSNAGINLRRSESPRAEEDRIYLDMILLMVALGVAAACLVCKVTCRLYRYIFKGNEEEERVPVILTLVKQSTLKKQKSLKVLLLYARQEEAMMNLVQELREQLQIYLACEVIDIYHKDYEHRLNEFGFEFVEDFLHSDSCFNAHHEVKIVMIHTDWSLKIYEAQIKKSNIQYKDQKYIDSYYNEALKILIQAENVDYQKIHHVGFEEYPLENPLNRPKFNCSPLYYYPKELELFVQAIKRRPVQGIQEETSEDLQMAETPC